MTTERTVAELRGALLNAQSAHIPNTSKILDDLSEQLARYEMHQRVKIVPADAIVLDLSGEVFDKRRLRSSVIERLRRVEKTGTTQNHAATKGIIGAIADQIEEQTKPPEPEHETFGPGDVVRGRNSGDHLTLTRNGFVAHRDGAIRITNAPFTSEYYERVDL